MELSAAGAEAYFDFRFERGDWQRRKDVWRANFGLRGYPIDDTDHYRFVGDGRELDCSRLKGPLRDFVPAPGTFCSAAGGVFLNLAEGEEPPEEARLTYTSLRGREENGRWKVDGRRFSGAGLPIWPGERCERDIPGPGLLRFVTAGESAFSELVRSDGNTEVVFRIEHKGRILFEHALSISIDGDYRRHVLDLAPHLQGPATLEFSVQGDFAYTTFFSPVLTPTEVPARPA